MDSGGDTKVYADDVMMYTGENRRSPPATSSSRRATTASPPSTPSSTPKTRLGTFYNATGFSTVKPPKAQPPRPGAMAPPPVVGQDTVVIFFGEKIEKIGPKKYRITNGGFSTCVQPTPRWDLHAGTVLLNVDHYTVLTNAVLRVKGVPMFYTPILYYPTKRDDRATGFLMPTYGSSSLRGQSIHNGFFWAINRSQDATFAARLVLEDRPGLRQRVPLQRRHRRRQHPRATCDDQHATTYVRRRRHHDERPPRIAQL